jgi:hypothetical protein
MKIAAPILVHGVSLVDTFPYIRLRNFHSFYQTQALGTWSC